MSNIIKNILDAQPVNTGVLDVEELGQIQKNARTSPLEIQTPFLRSDLPSDLRASSIADLTVGDDLWVLRIFNDRRSITHLGTLTQIDDFITFEKSRGENMDPIVGQRSLRDVNVRIGDEETPQYNSHFLCTSQEQVYALETVVAHEIARRRQAMLAINADSTPEMS